MIQSPRIALVYDWVNTFGGAERILLALHEIWPHAPLYTSAYDPRGAPWAGDFDVRPSFMQQFPFAKTHHELYPWLAPIAFESFTFDSFDIVISVSSSQAKNIITNPHTLHICYCLTPTRYLWSGLETYRKLPGFVVPKPVVSQGFKIMLPWLRLWDIIGSTRPDAYIAISDTVSKRIAQYYKRKAECTIYPPVFTEDIVDETTGKNNYFLVVSRLVAYKRIDIIIDAFNRLGWPLVIVGEGREEKRLRGIANNTITFTGALTEKQLAQRYRDCRAFIHAAAEDFGISAAEAQSYGKPVIAYRESGVGEIVIPGKTGELFYEQTSESLLNTLKNFSNQWYDSALCRKNVQRFSASRFKREMKDMVEELYNRYI